MIDALKRKLGLTPATAPVAETEKEDVTMDVKETGDAALAAAETNAVEVAGLTASLATAVAALADSHTKIAELSALVAAATEFQAAQATAALATKQAARKLAVEVAVGTAKADALYAATASLEDAAFDAVMAAMATTATAEANTQLFNEVGVDAEASASKLADSNPVMDYLTAKYK